MHFLHSAFGIKPRMRYSFAHFQKKEEQNYEQIALVKDTASKLTPEKTPKAKSKTKKGPEL